jgi:hypothetical protein
VLPAALTELFAANYSASVYASCYFRTERVNRLLTFGGIVAGAVGLAAPERMNGFYDHRRHRASGQHPVRGASRARIKLRRVVVQCGTPQRPTGRE